MHGPSFLAADTHGTTALLRNHARTHALKHADDYDYYYYYHRKGQIAAEGFPVSHLTLDTFYCHVTNLLVVSRRSDPLTIAPLCSPKDTREQS